MEKRKVVSRILELQNSAAKSSTLESQKDEYVKRTSELEEEIKRLRSDLKQTEAERNTYEKDIAVYIAEKKSLNQQLSDLKSSFDNNAVTSERLFRELKDGNEKLMDLREMEYESNLDRIKAEMAKSNVDWTEKCTSVERKYSAMREEKRDQQKVIESLEKRLADAEKATSSHSLKAKIQIQALEAKIELASEEKQKLEQAHRMELGKLQTCLEEREKQLGAQSNVSKRMQKDMNAEVDSVKEELAAEIEKKKDLTTQITRLEIRIKATSENMKHAEEETRVKTKCLEEQVSVLKKDVESKSSKIDGLQSELCTAHNSNSDELQNLRKKMLDMKNEKKAVETEKNEICEEMESLKKGLKRELDSMQQTHEQKLEKLRKEFLEKEKRSAAQSCISRKVQEDVRRQLDSSKADLDNERQKNSDLAKELKTLELQLKGAQDVVKSLESDGSLKLRLSEEKVSALQQEIGIKNKKMHELQRQVLDAQEMNGKDVEELTEKLATAKKEKRAAQDKILELTEEKCKLERLKSKAELHLRTQKEKVASSEEELDRTLKKYKTMEQKCFEMQKELDSQILNKDASTQQLRDEVSQLRKDKRLLERENKAKSDLENEVEDLKKELIEVERKSKEMEKKLKSDIYAAEQEVNDVELEYKQQVDELQEKLSETQRKLASKNITSVTMCKKVEDDCQRQLQRLESREKENTENMKIELERSKKELRNTQVENSKLEKEKSKAETNYRTQKEETEEANGKLDQVSKKYKSLEAKCREMQADLDSQASSQSSAVQQLRVEVTQLRKDKRLLERESSDAKSDLENEIEDLKKQLREMRRELKETEKKVESEVEAAEKEACNVVSEYKEQVHELQEKLSETQRKLASKNIASVTICKKVEDDFQKQLQELELREKENSEILKLELSEARQELAELQEKLSDTQRKLASKNITSVTICKKVEDDCQKQLDELELREKENSEKLKLELSEARQELAELQVKLSETQRKLASKNITSVTICKKVEDDCQKQLEELELRERENSEKLKLELSESKQELAELQEKLSETQRKLASKNITSVTICKKVEDDCQKQLQVLESREKENSEKLKLELSEARQELAELQEEKATIEEKFTTLRESCSVIETLEEQLDEYHHKCQELQDQNCVLNEQLAETARERGGADREFEECQSENLKNKEKIEQLEKAMDTLKQTCLMLEEQIVDLEKFNERLVKNQEELSEEKEKIVKESREAKKRLGEVEHLVTMEKRRGFEINENNSEEIIELQVQVREEANKAQELQDELSDLDRKYKLLDMQAGSLQKKLNNEKENSDVLRAEVESYRSRMETLESLRSKTSHGLRSEVERADALAREKTSLQNELDTFKMKNSHEAIKLNCTIGQQSKLIDFLQAKIESLEPQDKKKKKKKNDLYQVPLQYRELQDMLDESKQMNIQLQQKVNDFRTELQNTKSEVSRLKHGINGAATSSTSHTLSPGSIAAITALVKSPNTAASPMAGNSRSKPRMHHNIPHRLTENLCTNATKCSICLDSVRFGRAALRCSECQAWCHIKCRSNMTSSCGLPGGLVQHYKQGGKGGISSPVSCISVGGGDGNVQGWLKVFCGGSSWEKKWVQLRDGVVIISNMKKPLAASTKRVKIDVNCKDRELIDLVQQQGYVHATVPASEVETTAKGDVPYVFKLELGPDTSCWPPRSLYFLSSGFTDKQQWVAALEAITTRDSPTQKTISDSKIIGNKIVTMQVCNKLEINCSLPISNEKVLFGCDEGLFILTPSTMTVCERSHMNKVSGAQQILQMDFLKSPNLIVAIEGPKRRMVTFDAKNLASADGRPSEMSVKLLSVDSLLGCHLFAIGSVEGAPHLCSATATTIQIHRFNTQLGRFVKRKEIATSEPCTCLQFTMCSIIMGTNQFYEIELKSYKVDEFLDAGDRSLLFDYDSFPVSVLQICQKNGKYEYLLCYHEFGVFVDCFGKRTRKDNITWSRLPLSFAYKSPYLIVTHFYSVEIIRIDPASDYNDSLAMQQGYLNLPSPRYLGPAITEGAAYLSGNQGGKVTVYCIKGNMEPPDVKENDDAATSKSCLKRRRLQLAASSQESLDDLSATKRPLRSSSIDSSSTTMILSETTNLSSDSFLSSDTSRWTMLGSKAQDTPHSSVPKRMRNMSCDSLDSIVTVSSDPTFIKYSEDDSASMLSGSRTMWKPVTPGSGKKQAPEKPVRRNKTPNKLVFDSVDV